MDATLPAPAEVRAEFDRLCAHDAEQAVTYLHDLGVSSGYLKEGDAAQNIRWTASSPYGIWECSINLAKPEKDPRAIAAAAATSKETPITNASAATMGHATTSALSATAAASALRPVAASVPHTAASVADASSEKLPAPLCDLCWENEGFPGTAEHPAKPGLRIAAIELGGERWGLQFSPYAYFPEHCIALSAEHRPMKIDTACLGRLLDFADLFPFYFIGSNADMPIVGGSILSHDHFQGGRHVFPLMKAPIERDVELAGLPQVRGGIVRWPASVLRLTSHDRTALARAATRVLGTWQSFSCEACGIVARDADGPHNTLNPIVYREGALYVMDLVLRNNRTDQAHPWGIFHPGEELHHIKKENIGLIEIMGLAILPPRLARELPQVERELAEAARSGWTPREVEARLREHDHTAPHASWAADIRGRRATEFTHAVSENAPLHPVLQDEVARVFAAVLEATGVFKRDATGRAGWNAFLNTLREANDALVS